MLQYNLSTYWGVSSAPFPFWFPFWLHCIAISSQLVQNILVWRVTYNERAILVLSFLRFSKMTSELITFNHFRCHSRLTVLGTRTDYWKPTGRGTDETHHWPIYDYLEMTGSQIQFELFNIYLVPHLMCHRTGCEVRKALKKQYLVNITATHKKLFP